MFRSRSSRAARPQPKTAPPRVELLEDRSVPAGFFLTGVGDTTSPPEPFARIFDTRSGAAVVTGPGNINAFPGFAGSVRVANGDVNRDGTDDIICAQGPGPGSASRVRIFDGAAALFQNAVVPIADFFVYSNTAGASQTPGFNGGVFVAAGDFNNDGFDELVTSPGAGARGHIKVFNFSSGAGAFLGSNPTLRASFLAYPGFEGEVRVTTLRRFSGPVPLTFLVTASGAGTTQSDVRLYQNVFNLGAVSDGVPVTPALQFFPFPGYSGGVSIAAGETDLGGSEELFVSKNSGVSNVRVFDINSVIASNNPTLVPNKEFTAFPGFLGEVRLGAADVDGDGRVEVLTSTGSSPGAQGSHIKAWNVSGTPTLVRSFFAYQGYIGGVWLSTNDFTMRQTFGFTGTLFNFPGGVFFNGF